MDAKRPPQVGSLIFVRSFENIQLYSTSCTCLGDSPLSKEGMREACLIRVECVATDVHAIRSSDNELFVT